MKHSHGNLLATFIPILILVLLAAAGWYYYYSEVNKNRLLAMESRSEQESLNSKLENLQSEINRRSKDENALQTQLESQKLAQDELTALLEKTLEEKRSIENDLQKEINRVTLTTAELEAELKKRRATQESLSNEIVAAVDEKSQLLSLLEQELENKKRIADIKNQLEQELDETRVEIISVSGEKSQLLTRLEQEQESKRQMANLKSRLEQELNESRVEISQLKNQMTVIKLTSEVLFSSGSAEIKPAGKKVLSLIAESLNSSPDRAISVEGHTDNVPILRNNRYDSNWELSSARALAAVNYFQQNSQVDPKRLKLVGYGQYHPVASNETAEGRKLNRRIEIKLLPPETRDVTQN